MRFADHHRQESVITISGVNKTNHVEDAVKAANGNVKRAKGVQINPPGEGGTKRAAEDAYAKFKYDATADQDNVIIGRVAELAEKHVWSTGDQKIGR